MTTTPGRRDLPPLSAEDHVCERCGLDYATIEVSEAVDTVAGLPDRYRAVVAGVPVADRGSRPGPDVWSVAEYVCHTRDVYIASTIRLYRTRTELDPVVEPLYNDLRAARFGYGRRDLDPVLDELSDDVTGFLTEVARMPVGGWDRTCTRLPGEQRTARWLVRQALHEGVHHLFDVEEIGTGMRK
jgi:hypothetical protein